MDTRLKTTKAGYELANGVNELVFHNLGGWLDEFQHLTKKNASFCRKRTISMENYGFNY